MSNLFIAGLINIETTLRVDDGFPFDYAPVRYPFFGVRSTVSGVGLNISKALTTLGDEVAFFSLIGSDPAGDLVLSRLQADGIPTAHVRRDLPETAQSVILYDGDGRRQIFTDLKDIQDRAYPPDHVPATLAACDLAVCCNINFSRPFLALAQQAGKPIASDVHTIADLEDPYNSDYMAAATILFMSDERLPCPPEEWARRLQTRYGTPILVIGLGRDGALLALREGRRIHHVPAVYTRPVVNSVGAGDSLFSAFLHGYADHGDPLAALQDAVVFASYKIGEKGAAEGFLSAAELAVWRERARPLA